MTCSRAHCLFRLFSFLHSFTKPPREEYRRMPLVVMYFDKSEHPANYDFAYNEQKIERWKKYGKPDIDFFLQMPLVDLMPFLTERAENLRIYSAVVEELNQVHLENLSTILETVSK